MEISALGTKLESVLASYYRPKYIYTVNHIPQTGNGKINRKECRVLAESLTVARETGIIKTAGGNLSTRSAGVPLFFVYTD